MSAARVKVEERVRTREVRSREAVCRSVVEGQKRRAVMVVACGVRGLE